ncbi:branched-chain amino acid ABC transporter permease [Haloarculaceae archaeon H-GB2-1]|nr:branched-chain amino acid ABC transporter permease [Haloarculaceae archaeon H-GB1-1]MEA5408639.1 branched-chain amino acid ABC transporter permease [Haloarculaceae archaeon H-GB2-1]
MSERGHYARQMFAFTDDHGWKLLAVLAFVGVVLPFVGLEEGIDMTILVELFLFAILALSWDLIGGQTGYPSFGQMAFFGVGAFTTAILVKDVGVAFPVAFAVAGLLTMLTAGVVGAATLRLRGGYFAIATLGVLLSAQQITRNLEITGGASGKILLDVPSDTVFYWTFLGLLIAEIAVVYYLQSTRFGYVLNAIRDDEGKLTAMGVNTTYYKTAAWMISALFTGLAGGSYSLFNTFVDPNVGYNLAWNVEMIAMALLGGSGTVAGPVLGAFGLHFAVVKIETWFTGWQLVVLGAVVIVTVIAFPQGIVGELRERASSMEYYKHGGQAASESPGGDDGGTDTDANGEHATDGGESL